MKRNSYSFIGLLLLSTVFPTAGCSDDGTGELSAPVLDDSDLQSGYCPTGGLLFWAESQVVRAAKLDGTGVTTVAAGAFPTSAAIDAVGRKVYWADNGSDSISMANYDGTAAKQIYANANGLANPDGLSLDPAANKLFWVEGQPVRSGKLDGTGITTVTTGHFATSTAVAPAAHKLYWTDNATDTIQRANYDGSSVETLYHNADPFSNPRGLAVDERQDRIFWAEGQVVRAAKLDGTGVVTVATGSFPTNTAVEPTTRKLYFTDNGTDTIQRANYDGSAVEVIYTNPDSGANPRGIVICHK
jgi:DNA-binding beta-propeller fold protein YncE